LRIRRGEMRASIVDSERKSWLWFVYASILMALSIFVFAGRASAQLNIPNPAPWITNGPVYAIVSAEDIVYIGGDFTYVSPCTGSGVSISEATGIASQPYLRINGAVLAVVADGSGGWYIGGEFTRVAGIERNHIAHILPDGSLDYSWNPNAD